MFGGEKKMKTIIDVNELWINGSSEDWRAALNHYYNQPSVKRHIDLENKMNHLDPETIKKLDPVAFYEFLYNEYYVWKYTANNRLVTTRKQLEKHKDDITALGRIQANIFKAFEIDPETTELLFCSTQQIHGLGTAGASGLLSILFPKYYGTVDQFLVFALQKIGSLPEHEKLQRIKDPENLKVQDGVLLENVLRNMAEKLNDKFGASHWTPRKVDMVLWASNRKSE